MDRRSGYEHSSKLYVHRLQVPEKNCNHESGTGVIGKRLARLILPRRGRGGRAAREIYIDLGNELRYVQNLLFLISIYIQLYCFCVIVHTCQKISQFFKFLLNPPIHTHPFFFLSLHPILEIRTHSLTHPPTHLNPLLTKQLLS